MPHAAKTRQQSARATRRMEFDFDTMTGTPKDGTMLA
ncbi:hypothetical protein N825_04995 [Skermanella stibiiresistens SB22]|uniref:Uncharacterized protein n=1 Tax=Skermanella stibiiresistens SB22 TaxID=1385369 RepID=W9H7Z2_9PROT|nr:hypothetical protein N825_04995 [Skermanella stibiiresistens SB22]